ncbi:hypothetical protein ACQ86N_22450 [Puia sp. P3]|uniref:hypothetical protein n=1 Tax=Puia sp. P3 TaxID=3423952 RepID=UPI003D66F257
MIVAGSGRTSQPRGSADPKEAARLTAAHSSDATVMIHPSEAIGDPASRPVRQGTLTWHFKMSNTRDVAFGASRAYIWDAARVNLPGGKKPWPCPSTR